MDCPFCNYAKAHKHGRTGQGSQRFKCPMCGNTFTETFDTLYYRRQLGPDEVQAILQSRREGHSLRGITRISQRSYNTVMSVVHQADQKAKMARNQEIQAVKTPDAIMNDAWLLTQKRQTPDGVDTVGSLSYPSSILPGRNN